MVAVTAALKQAYASCTRRLPPVIETRRRLVDAEARRLEALGATLVRGLFEDGLDHYGIAMRDPEGNEFDINLRSLARRSRRAVRMRYPPHCADVGWSLNKTLAIQTWMFCAGAERRAIVDPVSLPLARRVTPQRVP